MQHDLEKLSRMLLQPLGGESRVGPDLRDNPRQTSYSRLAERLEGDRRHQDSAGFQGEAADWHGIVRDAMQLLSKESKDLEVATWLVRGLYRSEGLNGLGAGVMLLVQMQEQYWEDLHPKDRAIRKGRLDWLEGKLVSDLQASAQPDSLPVDAVELRHLRQQCLALTPIVKAWPPKLGSLYGQDVPDLSGVVRALDMLAAAAGDKLVEMNASLDVSELLAMVAEDAEAAESGDEFAASRTGLQAPAIMSHDHSESPSRTDAVIRSTGVTLSTPASGPSTRKDAVRQIDELAKYFLAAEPLSPIGPALQRVARWARGSLRDWLGEMIDNEAVLTGIFKTLDMAQDERK